MHLAAARLLRREDDVVTEALQELDRRPAGLGVDRVGEARDEERDPQARLSAEGPTHHVAPGVGHQSSRLRKIADLLGLDLAIV